METNFETCFQHTLKEEGGFVNHPKDPGGITNLGVTRAAWEAYIKLPATEQDMRDLTPDMVRPFYRARYWDVCKCDDLPSGVDLVVFDVAVNAGPGRASRFLQEIVGVAVDGIIGPRTLAATANFGAAALINRISDRRERHYRALTTFPTFGRGWIARTERTRSDALKMV